MKLGTMYCPLRSVSVKGLEKETLSRSSDVTGRRKSERNARKRSIVGGLGRARVVGACCLGGRGEHGVACVG